MKSKPCPHCQQPAISCWTKLQVSPSQGRSCMACGGGVSVAGLPTLCTYVICILGLAVGFALPHLVFGSMPLPWLGVASFLSVVLVQLPIWLLFCRWVPLVAFVPPMRVPQRMPLRGGALSDARVAAVLQQIEAELRRIGVLVGDIKPAEIVHSAFGMNEMAFEQWLARVFLPQAREAQRTGQWPGSSQVGTFAVRNFDGSEEHEHLTNLLCEFDAIIEGR
jgi:uncharacterized protein YqcC (DUF446 family)